MNPTTRKEYGDFQTSPELASKCVERIAKLLPWIPRLVIEPTCGKGAFVVAAAQKFAAASRIVGLDIKPEYVTHAVMDAARLAPSVRVEVLARDFFQYDWDKEFSRNSDYVLVLGNPPWATNAMLGSFQSSNLPAKSNFQGLKGLDALTGKANFDISEWMLLQYVRWLTGKHSAFAVLCKTAVARKVARYIWANHPGQTRQSILHIDAKAEFDVSVDACLYVVEFAATNAADTCAVFKNLNDAQPVSSFGALNGALVSDIETARSMTEFLGKSQFKWRSGVKHDCSAILELRRDGANLINGLEQVVDVEPHVVYPLAKCSDVNLGQFRDKFLLVTQTRLNEPTSILSQQAPKAWRYLNNHAELLNGRSSRIYKDKPAFSLFGIGNYTFQSWKIAVASLYKELNFRLFGPVDGKPVVFDDTVSLLSFDSEEAAKNALRVLQSEQATKFFNSHIFWAEKRPISIEILNRLHIEKLAERLGVHLVIPNTAQRVFC